MSDDEQPAEPVATDEPVATEPVPERQPTLTPRQQEALRAKLRAKYH